MSVVVCTCGPGAWGTCDQCGAEAWIKHHCGFPCDDVTCENGSICIGCLTGRPCPVHNDDWDDDEWEDACDHDDDFGIDGDDRVLAARRFLHATHAWKGHPFPCIGCPAPSVVAAALDHLDAHPRDARGARRIFHDARCVSGCGPDSDHADRTQATTVAALRRFRRQEAS